MMVAKSIPSKTLRPPGATVVIPASTPDLGQAVTTARACCEVAEVRVACSSMEAAMAALPLGGRILLTGLFYAPMLRALEVWRAAYGLWAGPQTVAVLWRPDAPAVQPTEVDAAIKAARRDGAVVLLCRRAPGDGPAVEVDAEGGIVGPADDSEGAARTLGIVAMPAAMVEPALMALRRSRGEFMVQTWLNNQLPLKAAFSRQGMLARSVPNAIH